jgi:hypothetical protein
MNSEQNTDIKQFFNRANCAKLLHWVLMLGGIVWHFIFFLAVLVYGWAGSILGYTDTWGAYRELEPIGNPVGSDFWHFLFQLSRDMLPAFLILPVVLIFLLLLGILLGVSIRKQPVILLLSVFIFMLFTVFFQFQYPFF